jgi:hypothetical protein
LFEEGERLLNDDSIDFKNIEIYAEGFECSNRPTQIIKAKEAYTIYKKLIVYYAAEQLVLFCNSHSISSFEDLAQALPQYSLRLEWVNIGGQLLPKIALTTLLDNIKKGTVKTWHEVHQFYQQNAKIYSEQKLHHAFASLLELLKIEPQQFTPHLFSSLLNEAIDTKAWMTQNIYDSRAKDYQNEFRKMIYDNETEMENVIGKLDDNVFINQQREELVQFSNKIKELGTRFKL